MDRNIDSLNEAKKRIRAVLNRSEYINNQNEGDLELALLLIVETISNLKFEKSRKHENDQILFN